MHVINLQGLWHVSKHKDQETIEARVPGCIHLDLLNANKIEAPFYRDNEGRLKWIGETDWAYVKTFAVDPEVLDSRRIILQCDGLDTLADVYINDIHVGSADNMFRSWEWDIAHALQKGPNTIRVHFKSVISDINKRQKERFFAVGGGGTLKKYGTSQVRKEQCNFGWDWGPACVTCGIWRPLRILGYKFVRMTELDIRQQHTDNQAQLHINIATDRIDDTVPLTAYISVSYQNQEVVSQTVDFNGPDAGTTLVISQPHLWWPNGMGDQHLYDVSVIIRDNKGRLMDATSRRVGFRSIALVQEDDQWGNSFYFRVNGRTFFAKGANWIPADVFQTRVTEDKYRQLLQDCVDVHMNMVRIWGGGIYEEDIFYDICDELGLLVWQDFMYACAAYPVHRQAFHDNVRLEAEENVKRLRHHACIALYCGNNELEQGKFVGEHREGNMTWDEYKQLFDHTLPNVVKTYHPQINYIPSSPYSPQGDREDSQADWCGDSHCWEVWNNRHPLEAYRESFHRFCSEFGFQSFPEPRTCYEFTTEIDRNINSYIMNWHQRNTDGNPKAIHYILSWHRLPNGFENTIWLSQIMQGMAIKYAVEHWRRNMPRCMGALYWQLNDCWPVASWASTDYHGRWKALHYMAKRFFNPILLSCLENPKDATLQLHLSSDLLQSKQGQIKWLATDLQGTQLDQGKIPAATPINGSCCIETLDLKDLVDRQTPRNLMIWIELEIDGEIVSDNFAAFARPKDFDLLKPQVNTQITQNQDNSFRIELQTDVPALWAWSQLTKTDVVFSDNFFCMRPGKTYTINATPAAPMTLETFESQFKAMSVYDTVVE